MALRSSWQGYLKLSLLAVPVRAYNSAVSGHGEIHFHQIHAKCGNRIRYAKFCPIHGEVTKDEIVSGYEYDKDKYVEIDPEELSKLRTDSEKAINIDVFIEPEELDPVYYSGRTYYLAPDGPAGQKPYTVLHQVMAKKNRFAIAQIVFSGREELVLIRPIQRLLAMTVLNYDNQVKKPSSFEDEVKSVKVSDQELKLADTLIEASTAEDFDFSQYKDNYTETLTKLIEAKAAGQKIVTPRKEEEPAVINLMDALRKSLARTGRKGKKEEHNSHVNRLHRVHRNGRKKKTG
jgi:DNA end-binding protein Ku